MEWLFLAFCAALVVTCLLDRPAETITALVFFGLFIWAIGSFFSGFGRILG